MVMEEGVEVNQMQAELLGLPEVIAEHLTDKRAHYKFNRFHDNPSVNVKGFQRWAENIFGGQKCIPPTVTSEVDLRGLE